MTARLPAPGQDDGVWGTILNDFLSQSHNPDGTLRSGAVSITKADVGLGNADNTADLAKPVSSAVQTAFNNKADTTRQILAGTGLAGGGDLSTDRTLTVAYGTTSGTAAAGNDPRIVSAVKKGDLVYNVKDYGAAGDGLTDDASAIQLAVAAVNSTHSSVFFPSGV